MPNSAELFKKRIVQLASKHGFKAELARKMGVSPTAIQDYFTGERTPGLDQLDKFAEALGISPWELITPDDHKPKPKHSDFALEECAKRLYDAHKGFKEPRDPTDKNRYREPVSE